MATRSSVALLLSFLIVIVLLVSIIYDEKYVSFLRGQQKLLRITASCPMHMYPFGHKLSNLAHVNIENVPYFPQFAWVDIRDQQIYLQCDGKISILGPDSPQYHTADNDKWIHISRDQLQKPKIESVNPSQEDRYYDGHSTMSLLSWSMLLFRIEQWQNWWNRRILNGMKVWHLPWEVIMKAVTAGNHHHIANITIPAYIWIVCDAFPEANLILRPPLSTVVSNDGTLTDITSRSPLLPKEQQDIASYMHYLSAPTLKTDFKHNGQHHQSFSVSQMTSTSVTTNHNNHRDTTWTPRLSTIVIIYLDAVSKVKFDHFFTESKSILEEMSSPSKSTKYTHTAIELRLLHSLGQNSHVNYPQFLSGISKENHAVFFGKRYNKQHTGSVQLNTSQELINDDSILKNMREPWLFDIAEKLKFKTFQGESGMCSNFCNDNCYDKSEHEESYYEFGGFTRQYMAETESRFPAGSVFHHSICCEARYRKSLFPHSGHIHKHSKYDSSMWVGDKLSQSYGYDWFRQWLKLTRDYPRFGVMVSEETHGGYFVKQVDQELAQLIYELVNKRDTLYNMSNAGIIIMSDHGLHFGPEFETMTGRMANKNPFGYILLPTQYVNDHPQEYQHLLRNSQQMITSYDLRSTVLYWMTGREWSSSALHQRLFLLSGSEEREKMRLMMQRVYASKYGVNLQTETISDQRNCSNAGIAEDFCGCYLLPCDPHAFPMIHSRHKLILQSINQQLHSDDNVVLSVCKPLSLEDVSLLVPSKANTKDHSECLANDASMVINAQVHRGPGYVISITFAVDFLNHQPTDVIKDVFMVSSYQAMWNKCSKRLRAKGITDDVINNIVGQFCFCE